jgi:RND family efflux transporter MFP subunit
MKRTSVSLIVVGVGLLGVGAGVLLIRHGGRPTAAFLRWAANAPERTAPEPGTEPGSLMSTPRGPITIDSRRQQLIGVRTVPATRSNRSSTVRTVGSIRSAESRLIDVNVKLDGWIRDLYVDYTGQPVAHGQALFSLYSPDLTATEHEYLLALKARDEMKQSPLEDARTRADQLVGSARQRLLLWDLPEEDLRLLEEQRRPIEAVTVRSPMTGVVMEKMAVKGMHVTAGQTLYKIADLASVWIEADVYEADLALLRMGQRATVTLDAYPGERFSGRVLYIYPYIDEKTRTNKVRFEFVNRGGRLKPGMFATVEMTAPSPMAVVVPADAVLDSGQEQVVFVSTGGGHFEPRTVKVGRRLGEDIQILDGVKEGELVATGAAFLLDSESQLRASLRDYQPTGEGSAPAGADRAVGGQLDIVFRTVPDPPKMGENQLEATVRDARGTPVEDAEVSVEFFMPAMPTMNMPAMRSQAKLSPVGGGRYRGAGQVVIAGRWEATVTVTRGGQRLGSTQLPVVAH